MFQVPDIFRKLRARPAAKKSVGLTEVPLTTVGPLLKDLAERAADVMVALIEGKRIATGIVVEPVLVARASVGEAAAPDAAPRDAETVMPEPSQPAR